MTEPTGAVTTQAVPETTNVPSTSANTAREPKWRLRTELVDELRSYLTDIDNATRQVIKGSDFHDDMMRMCRQWMSKEDEISHMEKQLTKLKENQRELSNSCVAIADVSSALQSISGLPNVQKLEGETFMDQMQQKYAALWHEQTENTVVAQQASIESGAVQQIGDGDGDANDVSVPSQSGPS